MGDEFGSENRLQGDPKIVTESNSSDHDEGEDEETNSSCVISIQLVQTKTHHSFVMFLNVVYSAVASRARCRKLPCDLLCVSLGLTFLYIRSYPDTRTMF